MRRMLARAALVLAMGTAAAPMCDSGRVANAEGALPAPVPVQDEQRRPSHELVDYIYPPPLDEPQRRRLCCATPARSARKR